MGLGKTKQVIDIAVIKKEQFQYQHCLIICGVNGLKWNWLSEIGIHSDEDAVILGSRNKKQIANNINKQISHQSPKLNPNKPGYNQYFDYRYYNQGNYDKCIKYIEELQEIFSLGSSCT